MVLKRQLSEDDLLATSKRQKSDASDDITPSAVDKDSNTNTGDASSPAGKETPSYCSCSRTVTERKSMKSETRLLPLQHLPFDLCGYWSTFPYGLKSSAVVNFTIYNTFRNSTRLHKNPRIDLCTTVPGSSLSVNVGAFCTIAPLKIQHVSPYDLGSSSVFLVYDRKTCELVHFDRTELLCQCAPETVKGQWLYSFELFPEFWSEFCESDIDNFLVIQIFRPAPQKWGNLSDMTVAYTFETRYSNLVKFVELHIPINLYQKSIMAPWTLNK